MARETVFTDIREEIKPEISKIVDLVIRQIQKTAPKVKNRVCDDDRINLIYMKQFFLEEVITALNEKV